MEKQNMTQDINQIQETKNQIPEHNTNRNHDTPALKILKLSNWIMSSR